MSDLPSPLTPPDCDLRGFEWMALHGHRLFTSGWYLAAMKDPRGGIAALKLWWAAMLQCPAGSLPNGEDELCLLADFGQDMKAWRKHRAVAMRGFVLCSDNRYYHPMVAEQAIKAYESRLKASATRLTDADRLRRWRAANGGSHPPEKPNGQAPPETRFSPVSPHVSDAFRNPSRNADETRLTVQYQTEPEKEKKESKSKNLLPFTPVLARVAAACETPPAGTYGAPIEETATKNEPAESREALRVATKNILGKVTRRLETTGKVPPGRAPKLTLVEQGDAIRRGPILDETGQEPLRRGPVDPQRTVEEQLAWIAAEIARDAQRGAA